MRKFQNKTPTNCHTRAQKAGKTETLATMSPGAADRTPNPAATALARAPLRLGQAARAGPGRGGARKGEPSPPARSAREPVSGQQQRRPAGGVKLLRIKGNEGGFA